MPGKFKLQEDVKLNRQQRRELDKDMPREIKKFNHQQLEFDTGNDELDGMIKEELKARKRDGSSLTLVEGIRLQSAIALKRQYTQTKELFLSYIAEGTALHKKYFTREIFRVRLMGYTFAILIQNCRGRDFSFVEKIFDKLEAFGVAPFDFDTEILDEELLIPLTGSLYDDIRTSYFAKATKKISIANAMELLSDMLDLIGEQLFVCVESAYQKLADVPNFFVAGGERMHEKLTKENLERWFKNKLVPHNERKNLTQKEKQYIDGINTMVATCYYIDKPNNAAFDPYNQVTPAMLSRMFTCNCNAAYGPIHPGKSICDQRLLPPESAMLGINLQKLVCDEPDEDDTAFLTDHYAFAECSESVWVDPQEIQAHFFAATIIDRERLEWDEKREQARKTRALKKKESVSPDESLKKEILSLRAELANEKQRYSELDAVLLKKDAAIHHLTERNEKLTEENTELSKEVDLLTVKNKSLEQEVDALQDTVRNEYEEEGAPVEDQPLDKSVLDGLNIVCFGGHPTWKKAMREEFPSVRFFDSIPTHMLTSIVTTADVVWLQSNALSHAEFDSLIKTVRTYGAQIRYFRYAGVRFCSKQLIEEVGELLGGR